MAELLALDRLVICDRIDARPRSNEALDEWCYDPIFAREFPARRRCVSVGELGPSCRDRACATFSPLAATLVIDAHCQ